MLIGVWSTKTNKLVLQMNDKDPWTPQLLTLMRTYERKHEVFIKENLTKAVDCSCSCCVAWGCERGCACFPKELPPNNNMDIN